MKKILILLIAVFMLFALASCGGKDSTEIDIDKDLSISDNNVQSDNSKVPETDDTNKVIDESIVEDEIDSTEETDASGTEEIENENTPHESTASDEEAPATGIRPDFKEAMDAYEAFYEEYCDFMKKYSENPTDLTLLTEYGDMLTKAAEMDKTFEEWNEDDLTAEELQYYMEVNNRVMQMLVDVMG